MCVLQLVNFNILVGLEYIASLDPIIYLHVTSQRECRSYLHARPSQLAALVEMIHLSKTTEAYYPLEENASLHCLKWQDLYETEKPYQLFSAVTQHDLPVRGALGE